MKHSEDCPHPQAIILAAGDICGHFEIIEKIAGQDGLPIRAQRYRVKNTCCGTELDRSHSSLLNAKRRAAEVTRCQRCQNADTGSRTRLGDRFGPVVVMAMPSPNVRVVRWDCCGRLVELSPNRLSVLRHDAKNGRVPLCRACQRAARAKAMTVDLDIRPRIKREVAQPGFISPATAWPRPSSLTGARA
jgi:hypothetical protein